ncbi:MAG: DUF1934 domain-containing protein [Eubacterium sp.]|nr:DUF1934 domain-containing protein [Eubacterium sp.]
MAQEVKITIHGLQAQGNGEPVEVVSVGQMEIQDGFACITYDEVVSEEENGLVQVVKNTLKISDGQVEVVKKGSAASHLVFIPDQTTFTYYSTPIGEIEVSIHTNQIEKIELESGFFLKMDYDLEMNQTFISNCNVQVTVEQ